MIYALIIFVQKGEYLSRLGNIAHSSNKGTLFASFGAFCFDLIKVLIKVVSIYLMAPRFYFIYLLIYFTFS